MGRRVQKTVYAYGSGSWQVQKVILFVYDGWNVAKEITREGGSDNSRYFVWGLDLSQSVQGAGGVGGLLAVVDGSLTYHYLYDANGNVGQVINAGDGSVVAHYEYDPFGNMVNQAGDYAGENPYRFSTKYRDAETGLYYYGYRYYSTELGRWLNRDPLGEDGGNNLFTFIVNNPINEIDLLGLSKPLGCKSLETKIASFVVTQQDKRAWNRFTSGQGIDILLSAEEVISIKNSARKINKIIKDLSKKCLKSKTSSDNWFAKTYYVRDKVGSPWKLSIGQIKFKLTSTCIPSCTFTWALEINDFYDFDLKGIPYLSGREGDAEAKTWLVRIAQECSGCGWKEFYHKGSAYGCEGIGCHK